ncbi:MAG: DNA primase [Clostridiales bacterium]|nr:DNA primase [Clostridiales bacterium]
MLQNRGFGVDWLSELKRKNDIVSIASNYLQMEQKGRRFWACCPFHNEKTPSFSINNEDGIYYCFGCKESGDVIKFVQKMENIDFMDAVKLLADKVGMEVPELASGDKRKETQKQKERILSALDYAYKHYVENLYNKDAVLAQNYIKKRKLTRRELEDFKIGYSKNWTDIVDYLKGKGFSEKEMLDAGICAKKNNRIYDVVAGRLVFPIFNSFNECIGFSARALEKTDFAKYLNTAETMVFQKGRVVFGINLLKSLKHQQLLNKIILVEGQMDVVAMHRGGFKSTVACMGTALTKDHVQELKRYCDKIVICFDGDGAGTKATLRAIEMFRNENVDLKIVALPEGKDPDEILNTYGSEKLQEMIDGAKPFMDYLIEHYQSKYNLDNAEEKGRFVKIILGEIRKLGSATLFEPYLEKIRDLTKIPIDVLRREVNNEPKTTAKFVQPKTPQNPVEKSDEKAVKFLLASLLHKKDFVDTRIDYEKLLVEYKKYLDIIKQNLPLSAIFDIEGASEDVLLMEILNFNFSDFQREEERYYRECLWKIAEQQLKKRQEELNIEYKTCEDLMRRGEIAKKLGKIALQLKNKSLEDFNGRR